MNPSSRLPSVSPFAALILGAAAAFLGCMDTQVAGSSVTTGNPTEIQVGFTEGGTSASFTGRVALYGATQIPVPGFQPAPLDSWSVAGASEARLTAQDLADIPDSAWPKGSTVGDSLRLFNLVVTGGSKGAITRELAYRIKSRDFDLKEGALTAGTKAGVARIAAPLAPMSRRQAFIKPESLNSKKKNYLYLPGTGYAALEDSGYFDFPSMPEGAHTLSLLPVPREINPATREDTLIVYRLDLPLDGGALDTLSILGVDFKVRTPPAYLPD